LTIKDVAKTYFVTLYYEQEGTNLEVSINVLENISIVIITEENTKLLKPIKETKILNVIWGLTSNKSPSLNNFSIHFYIAYWSLIKTDLKRMLQYVQKSCKLGGNTNSSFIVLIPKEANPSAFSRFQPVSLCNSSYKITTKIVSNRLKIFFPK
jgi:hypothetical protein